MAYTEDKKGVMIPLTKVMELINKHIDETKDMVATPRVRETRKDALLMFRGELIEEFGLDLRGPAGDFPW